MLFVNQTLLAHKCLIHLPLKSRTTWRAYRLNATRTTRHSELQRTGFVSPNLADSEEIHMPINVVWLCCVATVPPTKSTLPRRPRANRTLSRSGTPRVFVGSRA
jgi:hypothetical protein